MITIDNSLKPQDLQSQLKRFWQLSGEKILHIDREYDEGQGAPVFTDKRQIFHAWLDGMDPGLSVRLGHPAI